MEEFKDFLHLYLGCECLVTVLGSGNTHKVLLGCSLLSKHPFYRNPKPILRPLSSMADDELSDVYTIERDRLLHIKTIDFDIRKTDNCFIITRLDLLDERLIVGFKGELSKVIECGMKHFKSRIGLVRNQYEITGYLLSKHFDIFGLHDAGLCLYEEDLK